MVRTSLCLFLPLPLPPPSLSLPRTSLSLLLHEALCTDFSFSHHAWTQQYGVPRLSGINRHLNRILCVRIVAVALADARNFDLFQMEELVVNTLKRLLEGGR